MLANQMYTKRSYSYRLKRNLSLELLAVKVKREIFHRICMKNQPIFLKAGLYLVAILW